MDLPMWEMLQKAQGRVRMHMPGHKGKAVFGAGDMSMDMTEISVTDDLFCPGSGILKAQQRMARAARAGASIMLSGGSTSGVLAMVLWAVRPGQKLIVQRSAHHSAVSACVLSGAQPVWVEEAVDEAGLCESDGRAILSAIQSNKGARAVLVTYPDYYGRCIPLKEIVDAAHEADMLVLVDSAHGCHFNWWQSPACAGVCGADLWVQSAHKTLPALTPGAWLHMSDRAWEDEVRGRLSMVHTSSPSFLVMESLDRSRAWMDEFGARALERARTLAANFRQQISRMEGLFDPFEGALYGLDPTRLTVDVSGRGLSGWRAAQLLAECGIDVEMADHRRVVAITGACDEAHDFEAYLEGLNGLPLEGEFAAMRQAPLHSAAVMTPRQAALSAAKWVPLGDAEGEVAARSVGTYPPGVAWLAPGEVIRKRQILALQAAKDEGALLFGLRSGAEDMALVVDDE